MMASATTANVPWVLRQGDTSNLYFHDCCCIGRRASAAQSCVLIDACTDRFCTNDAHDHASAGSMRIDLDCHPFARPPLVRKTANRKPARRMLVGACAELHELVAQLPDALASHVPDLMIDYVATVFTDEDIQPVSR